MASIGPFFPDYVKDVLPLGVNVYVPLRESLVTLAASPGALITLFILATAVLTADDRIGSPALAISIIATLGAGLAYFIQGKGWVYQAVPAMMFATIAGGFALGERETRSFGAIAVGRDRGGDRRTPGSQPRPRFILGNCRWLRRRSRAQSKGVAGAAGVVAVGFGGLDRRRLRPLRDRAAVDAWRWKNNSPSSDRI